MQELHQGPFARLALSARPHPWLGDLGAREISVRFRDGCKRRLGQYSDLNG